MRIVFVCGGAPTGTGAHESDGGTVRFERPSVASCSRSGEPTTPASSGSFFIGSPPTSQWSWSSKQPHMLECRLTVIAT